MVIDRLRTVSLQKVEDVLRRIRKAAADQSSRFGIDASVESALFGEFCIQLGMLLSASSEVDLGFMRQGRLRFVTIPRPRFFVYVLDDERDQDDEAVRADKEFAVRRALEKFCSYSGEIYRVLPGQLEYSWRGSCAINKKGKVTADHFCEGVMESSSTAMRSVTVTVNVEACVAGLLPVFVDKENSMQGPGSSRRSVLVVAPFVEVEPMGVDDLIKELKRTAACNSPLALFVTMDIFEVWSNQCTMKSDLFTQSLDVVLSYRSSNALIALLQTLKSVEYLPAIRLRWNISNDAAFRWLLSFEHSRFHPMRRSWINLARMLLPVNTASIEWLSQQIRRGNKTRKTRHTDSITDFPSVDELSCFIDCISEISFTQAVDLIKAGELPLANLTAPAMIQTSKKCSLITMKMRVLDVLGQMLTNKMAAVSQTQFRPLRIALRHQCRDCRQVNAFLKSTGRPTLTIRVSERRAHHVHEELDAATARLPARSLHRTRACDFKRPMRWTICLRKDAPRTPEQAKLSALISQTHGEIKRLVAMFDPSP